MNFEVYENNGGVLTLFVIKNGTVVAAFRDRECADSSLRNALAELFFDPAAWKRWGGDFGGDKDGTEREITIQELHDECAEEDDLICWGTGNHWHIGCRAIGSAGISAMGLDAE